MIKAHPKGGKRKSIVEQRQDSRLSILSTMYLLHYRLDTLSICFAPTHIICYTYHPVFTLLIQTSYLYTVCIRSYNSNPSMFQLVSLLANLFAAPIVYIVVCLTPQEDLYIINSIFIAVLSF